MKAWIFAYNWELRSSMLPDMKDYVLGERM
jgi:hypothetical protein